MGPGIKTHLKNTFFYFLHTCYVRIIPLKPLHTLRKQDESSFFPGGMYDEKQNNNSLKC